jgi:bacillithiol biosynthesis deacetylase BshB1
MEPLVMVIAPHQDDAEIGMGGTIAALRRECARIVIVDLSDGEPTPHGSSEIRARETKAASQILKVDERELLGLRNREIMDSVESRNKLAACIRKYRPTIIFGPHWDDVHPDHVQASALVDAARFYAKFVKTDLPYEPWHAPTQFYFFSTHMKVRVEPSFVYDISQTLEAKMAAIRAFESQFVVNAKNSEKLTEIETEARYWGHQIGVEAGEPFVSRENIRVEGVTQLFSL